MKVRISQLSVLFLVMSLFFVSISQAQETPTTSSEKEFKVSEKVLKKYVGTYTFDNGARADVTVEDGKLYGTQAGSGEGAMHLFAVSKTRFKIKALGVEIEFNFNDKGEVTGLTFSHQGQDITGTKG